MIELIYLHPLVKYNINRVSYSPFLFDDDESNHCNQNDNDAAEGNDNPDRNRRARCDHVARNNFSKQRRRNNRSRTFRSWRRKSRSRTFRSWKLLSGEFRSWDFRSQISRTQNWWTGNFGTRCRWVENDLSLCRVTWRKIDSVRLEKRCLFTIKLLCQKWEVKL